MQAFMHSSFWHTNGKKIIADLQEIADDTTYILTDPALLLLCGDKYGTTDVGDKLNHRPYK